MTNNRLILLEGLPGTGKSTNAQFLFMQLDQNGRKVKWIHEVARPHPCSIFDEAILSHAQYDVFLSEYPHAKPILDGIAVFRKGTVGIDLMELKWNYLGQIGATASEALQEYDGWNFPLEKYAEAALDKWAHFAEEILANDDTLYILDSALFQYPIFTYLLKNAPYEALERFIMRLIEIMKPVNPALIYFYRENPLDTIDFLERLRGKDFMERIWARDRAEPYYANKPVGAAGQKCFLMDYAELAGRLFDAVDIDKDAIEITAQHWPAYENRMLSHFGLQRKAYLDALPPNGVFVNPDIEGQIVIDGLSIREPEGSVKRLTPRSAKEFYVEMLPVILRFEGEDALVISGGQIAARWTTTGTRFVRV